MSTLRAQETLQLGRKCSDEVIIFVMCEAESHARSGRHAMPVYRVAQPNYNIT